ncbi:MAG: 2-oxoglutarate dehydrogenase, E2 component, dihydrolipoamide succinyltransferase [Ignavibacteria bacterium]|nr:2-oxoglutarate dehydrogenase, E2 component, dihydrolipoamide succinyltransferase [Ignavibacteria bacterium]
MKVEVVMPKMGESVNEGTIIKWHKKVGDKVDKDEIIFEISTDKVDTEIPSPASGILAEIKVFEQETVPVGTVVALIETDATQEIKPQEPSPETTQEKSTSASQSQELIDVVMPKMGESVTQGTIIKWHKNVGDKVAKDETLFEISTDKVDTEVPSPAEGVLAEILVKEQETVDVGVVVARISPTGYVLKVSREETKPVEMEQQVTTQKTEIIEKKEKTEKSRFYSPLVLKIAQEEKVSMEELEMIEGTGLGGRVTKKDILNYIEQRKAGKVAPPKPVEPKVTQPERKVVEEVVERVQFAPGEKVKIEPMDHMRQLIMEHMVKSRDTSVHVVGIQEVDMTKIHNYIQKNKDAFFEREGVKLTYLPFIVDAVVKALKEYPYVNASIDGKNIVLKNYINIGIAVALEPMGLIVPVIKNADEKNITGLAKSIYDLATRARSKKLLPDEVKDSTFTITNYGLYGTLFGNPIINQPEVAILGVGAVTKKPVVVEVDGQDTIAIRHMMYISLCHDHRLIDGALAGKFMRRVKELLENFEG